MFPSMTGAILAIEHLAATHPEVAAQLDDIRTEVNRYDVAARNCAHKFALRGMLLERKVADLEALIPRQAQFDF
jgi:hypothetical protein